MLYDPKWKKTTKSAPSLLGLIAWLETKDPATKYQWSACDGTCLIDQYLTSIGAAIGDGDPGDPAYDNYFAAQGGGPTLIALGAPRTFGAALERARAAAR